MRRGCSARSSAARASAVRAGGSWMSWPRSSRSSAPATTVVFDATVPPATSRSRRPIAGSALVFALGDEDADSRIEQIIGHDSNPRTLTVVSSDRRIRQAASRRRARPLTADAFWDLNDHLPRRRPAPRGRRPSRSRIATRATDPDRGGVLARGLPRRRGLPRDPRDLARPARSCSPTPRSPRSSGRSIARTDRRRRRRDRRHPGKSRPSVVKPNAFETVAPASGRGWGRSVTRGPVTMKVHEYQAKELLKRAGVAVPEGIVVTRPEEAAKAYDDAGRRLDRGQGPGPRRRPRQGGGDRARRRPRRGARDRQRAEAAARRRWPRACSSSGRPRRRRTPPPACWARRW